MVTPAPDAEQEPGAGQNTGVSGARLTIADSAAVQRRLPIRYADSGADEHDAGYDEELVYEIPAGYSEPGTGYSEPGTDYSEPVDEGAGTSYGEPVSDQAGTGYSQSVSEGAAAGYAEPVNEGISILGDIPTTVVPAEEPPTAELDAVPYEDAPTTDMEPVRAAWNEPIAAPPQPVGAGQAGQHPSFGQRLGGLVSGPAVDAHGNPRQTIRDLPPDERLRLWRNRVILFVAVGALFEILTRSPAVAVTLAILAGIIDTIYRTRTAGDIATGGSVLGARKKTRKQLAKMRRAGYLTLDARPIPNSRETIDHLVVGPTGVYAIDSEKWHPKMPVRTWNGKKLYHGPDSKKERLEHAAWEAKQASDILSAALGVAIDVRPAMAIYGPKIPWKVVTIREVDVFTGPALRRYLKMRGRMRSGVPRLTREQVRTIYDTASRVLPEVAPTMNPTPVG